MNTLTPLMLLYANYLYEKEYNTYKEVMAMDFKQLQNRFLEITKK